MSKKSFLKMSAGEVIATLASGKIRIPSKEYPMKSPFEVFDCENSNFFKDEDAIQALDGLQVAWGNPFQTAVKTYNTLVLMVGANAVSFYEGWLFSAPDYPMHHFWCVVRNDSGERFVIDLNDNYAMFFKYMATMKAGGSNIPAGVLFEDFCRKTRNIGNRYRCFPFGKVSPNLVYIGRACSPSEGAAAHAELIKAFPYHKGRFPADRTPDWDAFRGN